MDTSFTEDQIRLRNSVRKLKLAERLFGPNSSSPVATVSALLPVSILVAGRCSTLDSTQMIENCRAEYIPSMKE